MRSRRLKFSLASAIALVAVTSSTAMAQAQSAGAVAEVRDAAGRVVANAEFREGRCEVLVTILFPSPPVLSGTHAVHISAVGRCDPPDFTTSGAIFNPFNKQHGRQNSAGAEVGDLPNINFSSNVSSYNTTALGATLTSGSGSMFGQNGTALVILSGEDDQLTPPEGNAGARIACGVVTPAVVAPPSPAAAKPASSPAIASPAVVIKPAASPGAAAASPAPIAGVTPIVAPTATLRAAAPPQTNNGTSGLTALIIALLGAGLVAAGYLLRRRGQLQRRGS